MSKIKIIIIIVVILILSGGGLAYNKRMDKAKTNQETPADVNKIDYSPGTKEDQKQADSQKDDLYKKESSSQATNSTATKNVAPIITYAGQYGQNVEIGAYTNVFEDGGTCKAQIKQGSTTLEKQVSAVKNVSSVDCPVMSFETSKIPTKGTWQATVTYSSSTTTGTSNPRSIEVK